MSTCGHVHILALSLSTRSATLESVRVLDSDGGGGAVLSDGVVPVHDLLAVATYFEAGSFVCAPLVVMVYPRP
jgi:hypothetical protein